MLSGCCWLPCLSGCLAANNENLQNWLFWSFYIQAVWSLFNLAMGNWLGIITDILKAYMMTWVFWFLFASEKACCGNKIGHMIGGVVFLGLGIQKLLGGPSAPNMIDVYVNDYCATQHRHREQIPYEDCQAQLTVWWAVWLPVGIVLFLIGVIFFKMVLGHGGSDAKGAPSGMAIGAPSSMAIGAPNHVEAV